MRKNSRSGEPCWQIIGDGYLHGVMSGEAWDKDRKSNDVFTFV
jgi:hypothetical protein